MSLRVYCRLGYRINTKYLFSSYVSALRISSITSHIGHVLRASVQRAKKVVPDSPGLVDFAIGLVNSVLNLPDGQVMFFEHSNNRRTIQSILLVKKCLGLVEMTYGLVNANFSFPEWQAGKMIFFAPCSSHSIFFSSWAIFRSWSFRTLVVYVGIFCANPQVFALLTNVYLSFLFVCYFSVITETYVDCPDGSQCLDYETCCMMDTGHYGCCPLPKAVCCSDEEHCCPEGYRWSYYWMLIYFTLAPILSRESIRGGFLHKWAIYRRQRYVKRGRESARKLMRNATSRAQFAALSLVIFDDSRVTHLLLWFKVLYIFVVIAKHAQRSTKG